ncbi:MAG: hypothetical protein ACU0CA_13310 [Paracoccaceae bacterium]
MSAIDWLSDSITTPRDNLTEHLEPDVTNNALPETVTVSPLGGPMPDAVGLFPAHVSGLPVDLWRGSSSNDVARRLKADRIDLLPAMQNLLYTLLLAETDPPSDSSPQSILFLARLDTLLALGALEQADSLIDRAGATDPEIFRRAFDTSLLLRSESKSCATLRSTPSLSPTFPARIFCLARGGDWDAAALTLETARALGFVTEDEDELLARFLEPSLADNAAPLVPPAHPSPLMFRLLEAIGEPMPTTSLPRAFAQADLHTNSGWKAQIEAAERLQRTGALDPNQLLGLYTERQAAASGGVWDRVNAIQQLESAIHKADDKIVEEALINAWNSMAEIDLEVPFVKLFSQSLARFDLDSEGHSVAIKVGLLSDQYRTFAAEMPQDGTHGILRSIALGQAGDVASKDPLIAAIQDGFRNIGIPVRLQTLVSQGRMGEAMLRAMELFANGARGDLDELTDALMFLRSVGLEDTARRAALQLMLLERRG